MEIINTIYVKYDKGDIIASSDKGENGWVCHRPHIHPFEGHEQTIVCVADLIKCIDEDDRFRLSNTYKIKYVSNGKKVSNSILSKIKNLLK